MTYDAEAKNYVFFQVNNFGVSWTCRGTVSGDTWTWNGEATRNGKTILLRFTMKWTSKDSFDFKKEVGPNADSMRAGPGWPVVPESSHRPIGCLS
jgi:hypothetical protein